MCPHPYRFDYQRVIWRQCCTAGSRLFVEDDIFTIPEHPPLKLGELLLDALLGRADPGYFNALQIPLLSGRFFTREDTSDQAHPGRGDKVIINREFTREQFPGEDPLGKHLQVLLWSDAKYEIIGVVADTLHRVTKSSTTRTTPVGRRDAVLCRSAKDRTGIHHQ